MGVLKFIKDNLYSIWGAHMEVGNPLNDSFNTSI